MDQSNSQNTNSTNNWWNIEKLGFLLPLGILIAVALIVGVIYFFFGSSLEFKGDLGNGNIPVAFVDQSKTNLSTYQFGMTNDDLTELATTLSSLNPAEGSIQETTIQEGLREKINSIDYGVISKVRYTGYDYNTATGNTQAEYDPSKYFDVSVQMSPNGVKYSVSDANAVLAYNKITQSDYVVYSGGKYGIKIKSPDTELNSKVIFFDPNLLQMPALAFWNMVTNQTSTTSVKFVSDKKIDGKNYQIFEANTTPANSATNSDPFAPVVETDSQASIIRFYVDPKTGVAEKGEVRVGDKIQTSYSTIEMRKANLADLSYSDTELGNLELKEFNKSDTKVGLAPKVADVISNYSLLYFKAEPETSVFTQFDGNGIRTKTDYEKTVSSPDFTASLAQPESYSNKNREVSYVYGSSLFMIFPSTADVTKILSEFENTLTGSDKQISINGETINAKSYSSSTVESEESQLLILSFSYNNKLYVILSSSAGDGAVEFSVIDSARATKIDASTTTTTTK